MIFALYAIEAMVAWVLAAPWSETIARIFANHPDGDRALWSQPSHFDLVDLYLRYGSIARGLFAATSVGLALYFVFGLLPLGALLDALSTSAPLRLKRSALRAATLFGGLALIQLDLMISSAIVVVVLGILPSSSLIASHSGGPPWRGVLIAGLPIIVTALTVGFLMAAADLARALFARHGVRPLDACVRAVKSPREVVALFFLSMPRHLASVGAMGFAFAFSTRLSSILAIAILHQVVALGRVAMRASVVARALRISDEVAAKSQFTRGSL
ncbi:MAG: hypothetical protein NVS3B20_15990 [Polyangiales bacterium]